MRKFAFHVDHPNLGTRYRMVITAKTLNEAAASLERVSLDGTYFTNIQFEHEVVAAS